MKISKSLNRMFGQSQAFDSSRSIFVGECSLCSFPLGTITLLNSKAEFNSRTRWFLWSATITNPFLSTEKIIEWMFQLSNGRTGFSSEWHLKFSFFIYYSHSVQIITYIPMTNQEMTFGQSYSIEWMTNVYVSSKSIWQNWNS